MKAPRDVDIEALRRRYEQERRKRLRADGNRQYIEVKDEFASYVDDPHTARIERDPVSDEVDVLVIGAGFGGLLMGGRLREAGFDRIRLVDKAGGVGGTWYWNRYPGAQCDVESYIYLPLLEETGYMPREKYAYADEIREHAERVAQHFDLYRDALFQTEVRELRWQESVQRWEIKTDRGDCFRARFVCTASGPMNRPKLPGIPGIRSFKGHSFHTSRWDYHYTGGAPNEALPGLTGKRVGVIGTGATALQIVPHLSRYAQQLHVFQRTPSPVDERNNRPTDPAWVASLDKGWQRRRMENFDRLTWGALDAEDEVGDNWTKLMRRTREVFEQVEDRASLTKEEIGQLIELGNHVAMEDIRQRVEREVSDSATAEALKPYYRFFCKRPGFHDEYLQAFNRPNTNLVDTQGRGVEAITEQGVVVGGQLYELDCIIFATGFEVGTAFTRRSNLEAYGRDGLALSEHWADGPRTLHSYMTDRFPNLFFLSQVQGGNSYNFTSMADAMSRHLAAVLQHMDAIGAETLEPDTAAVDNWVRLIIESGEHLWRRAQEGCTPGYYNNEGDLDNANWKTLFYGRGPVEFFKILERWRADESYAGLLFDGIDDSVAQQRHAS